jgi:hypothetical protein
VVRCPVCTKVQVVYVQGPKRTSCYYCGARWIQDGAEQDSVTGRHAPDSALRSMGRRRTAVAETPEQAGSQPGSHEMEAAR